MIGARTLVLSAALGLAAAGCTMPEADGFQFTCNWNEVFHDDEAIESSELCPDGQVCRASCCVNGDEQPTCHLRPGFGAEGESAAGASCTGGCADYSCKGTCPAEGNLSCLDEQSTGFPGGVCTTPCGSCDGVCQQLPGLQMTCLAHCERNEHCRAGYRCDCTAGQTGNDGRTMCGCVPDCSSNPQACGEGRKVNGNRCDTSTGRCWACLPTGQGCVEGTDCCSGNCCGGLCSDGACQ